MAVTSTSQIDPAVAAYYDKLLLARAIPAEIHGRFGQLRPIKTRSGNQIKFRKYSSLVVATTPLTEGSAPAGKQLAKTDITATLAQYGDFVTLTDFVQLVNQDPVLNETNKLLGEQAGETIDVLRRDVLAAGTNVTYSTASARNTVNTTFDVGDLKTVIRTLKRQNAKPIKEMINASTGIGTSPIREGFIGLVHPDTTAILDGLTGYVAVADYPAQASVMPNEVGSFKELRFIESTNAKVFAGAGSATINGMINSSSAVDVYATIFLARDAYGICPLAGNAMQNIIKPLGSAGTADPLDQVATSGWKATTVTKILNENWMLRLEHGNTDVL